MEKTKREKERKNLTLKYQISEKCRHRTKMKMYTPTSRSKARKPIAHLKKLWYFIFLLSFDFSFFNFSPAFSSPIGSASVVIEDLVKLKQVPAVGVSQHCTKKNPPDLILSPQWVTSGPVQVQLRTMYYTYKFKPNPS